MAQPGPLEGWGGADGAGRGVPPASTSLRGAALRPAHLGPPRAQCRPRLGGGWTQCGAVRSGRLADAVRAERAERAECSVGARQWRQCNECRVQAEGRSVVQCSERRGATLVQPPAAAMLLENKAPAQIPALTTAASPADDKMKDMKDVALPPPPAEVNGNRTKVSIIGRRATNSLRHK